MPSLSAQSVFVTGTDTGIGKTHVALLLMQQAKARGLRVAGFKPVASGCEWNGERWQNSDALALLQASSIPLDYSLVNPYAFEPAIAPHIAASQQSVSIDFTHLKHCYDTLRAQVDMVVVEGAGGCLVPLDDSRHLLDLAAYLKLPVHLVIGLRLGCINHALLSVLAIRSLGVDLESLIFNQISPEPMPYAKENIDTILRFTGIANHRIVPFR